MFKDFNFSDWAVLGFIALFGIFGVLHIAFGLRNVVDALSTATAAAWIQAIGAIAAIGIAIWVANRSERMTERSAAIASKRFIEMAEAAVGGLYIVTGISSEEADVQRVRFLGELKEVQLIGQGIHLGHLPTELCSIVVEARTTVGRCVSLGHDISNYPQRFPDPMQGLRSHPRDGHTISHSLLKASWESMKELLEKSKAL